MKDLLTKIGRFCENHVEKIVLVIAGAVSAWLFFTLVIFSPNVVTLGGKNLSPGQIDRYVYEAKAQELNAQMQRQRAGKSMTYTPRLTGAVDPCDPVITGVIERSLPRGFAGLLESPLDFIDTTAVAKIAPRVATKTVDASRKYRLPLIPDVTDVAAAHLRAAVYVPTREVTPQAAYDSASSEPNDIDLVTVEGKIDTREIYRRYTASFNGVDVQQEGWRDPCLADPVFAAVQLQRQELLETGAWGEWRAIPRSRVESNQQLFRVIERVQDLPPGGLDVRMMQFDHKLMTLALLQPENYQIASAEEEWFPPTLYTKYKDLQKKVEAEERREQREKDRPDDRTADSGRAGLRGGAGGLYGGQTGATARGARGRGPVGGTGMDTQMRGGRGGRGGAGGVMNDPSMMTGGARGGRGGRRGGPEDMYGDMYGMPGMMDADGRRKPTTDEVYLDFRDVMITYRTDLAKMDEPVLVWVFDDTAIPGKTYRYRMRVGVFNPVAGTGQLVDRDMDKNDQVILWSRFTEAPQPVVIPRMVYLFAKDVQDKTKTATVEVARYRLGYWRTEDFAVKPGESIGKSVEPKEPERGRDRDRDRRMAAMTQMGGRITDPRSDPTMMMDPSYMGMPDPAEASKPKVIDYTTGKVLVDLVEVNDWGDAPNLRPRLYYDMLYTSDGMSIEHMPVRLTNWPRDLAEAYQLIQGEKRREPKAFRTFSKSGRGAGGMMDAYGGGMYDEMYNMGGGPLGGR